MICQKNEEAKISRQASSVRQKPDGTGEAAALLRLAGESAILRQVADRLLLATEFVGERPGVMQCIDVSRIGAQRILVGV